MKRVLLSALMLGTVGFFSGCGDEASTKTETTTKTPTGTAKETTEKKVEVSGSNPPAADKGAMPAPK